MSVATVDPVTGVLPWSSPMPISSGVESLATDGQGMWVAVSSGLAGGTDSEILYSVGVSQ